VLISTTEHLLSAFIGVGIDNAIVELDTSNYLFSMAALYRLSS